MAANTKVSRRAAVFILLLAAMVGVGSLAGSVYIYTADYTAGAGGRCGSLERMNETVHYSPPNDGVRTRATILGSSLDQITYAARRVTGGYEVEGLLPWKILTPLGTSEPLSRVQINVAVNYVVGGVRYQNVVHLEKREPPVAGCADGHPTCDDRTWCSAFVGT